MKGLCHGTGREGREGKEWITLQEKGVMLPASRMYGTRAPTEADGKPYDDAAAEGGKNQGMRRKGKSILLVRTVRFPFRQKAGGQEQGRLWNQDGLGDIRA